MYDADEAAGLALSSAQHPRGAAVHKRDISKDALETGELEVAEDGTILNVSFPTLPPVTRPANVRLAGEADEDALYDLLMALEADNGLGVPSTPEVVKAAIRKGTRRQGSMIGVIDGADELAASICITMMNYWYSDKWFLAELWLFVRPDYRLNRFDRDLFQFARWCREEMHRGGQDMTLITSVWSNNRLPARLRLWRRHSRQVGGLFVIE